MKVITPQSPKGNDESTAHGLTRSCSAKERRNGAYEEDGCVRSEKECYDNGCKPLKLKWVDKKKGEKCRSRLVCREIKRAKDRNEHLGPEDVF